MYNYMKLNEDQLKQVLEYLKEKITVNIKTRVNKDFLEIKVELKTGDKIFASSEDSVNINRF